MVDDDRVCLGEGVVGYSARVLGAALMTTLKTNEMNTCRIPVMSSSHGRATPYGLRHLMWARTRMFQNNLGAQGLV